jgi:hypothetical protein
MNWKEGTAAKIVRGMSNKMFREGMCRDRTWRCENDWVTRVEEREGSLAEDGEETRG